MTVPVQTLQDTCEAYTNDIVTRLKSGENLREIMGDFQSLFITDKHQGVDVLDNITVVATVTTENTHFWVEVLAIDKRANKSKQRATYVHK